MNTIPSAFQQQLQAQWPQAALMQKPNKAPAKSLVAMEWSVAPDRNAVLPLLDGIAAYGYFSDADALRSLGTTLFQRE